MLQALAILKIGKTDFWTVIPAGAVIAKTVNLLTPRNENFASHSKAYLKAIL